jgi:hypothetical protein
VYGHEQLTWLLRTLIFILIQLPSPSFTIIYDGSRHALIGISFIFSHTNGDPCLMIRAPELPARRAVKPSTLSLAKLSPFFEAQQNTVKSIWPASPIPSQKYESFALAVPCVGHLSRVSCWAPPGGFKHRMICVLKSVYIASTYRHQNTWAKIIWSSRLCQQTVWKKNIVALHNITSLTFPFCAFQSCFWVESRQTLILKPHF